MDSDERLTALKKAYADIILNTAKEAAARIMVSERKALRFQQELYVAKEEAVQMLLRLKHMMDSKISEAATASLSQQKKIEELEAQLQEAEDIVKELREELREAQTELERATNTKDQNLYEHNIATPCDISEEKRFYTAQCITFSPPQSHQHESVLVSDVKTSNSNQISEGHKCYNGSSYVGNLELPSIILRSKEPELYRNGCTQRIRACERNVDGESSLLGEPHAVKNETSVKEDEEVERICTPSTHEGDNMCNVEKKVVVEEETGLTSWHQVRPVKSLRRNRKKATRYRKNRTTPSRSCRPHQVTKMHQTPFNPSLGKNNAPSEEEPSQTGPGLSLDTTETGIHLGLAENNGTEVKNTINNVETIMDKLMPTGQDIVSTESSGVAVCKVELEKVDLPLVKSKSGASGTSNEVPSQPVSDRIIKYTFHRKRKREPLSNSNGNDSLDKGPSKRKMGEKLNGSLETHKSGWVPESSRDSRRLAQVARQLISLSEKKWWQ
ncbi:hypothetical protein LguiA_009540 [Lonicera macranthoides]